MSKPALLIVMSLTDIYGQGVDAATVDRMFDGDPHSKILDLRLLWGFLLLVPLWLGVEAISLDALIWSRLRRILARRHAPGDIKAG